MSKQNSIYIKSLETYWNSTTYPDLDETTFIVLLRLWKPSAAAENESEIKELFKLQKKKPPKFKKEIDAFLKTIEFEP